MKALFDISATYGLTGADMESAVSAVLEAAHLLERAYYRAHDHDADHSIAKYEEARAKVVAAALAIAAHKPGEPVTR